MDRAAGRGRTMCHPLPPSLECSLSHQSLLRVRPTVVLQAALRSTRRGWHSQTPSLSCLTSSESPNLVRLASSVHILGFLDSEEAFLCRSYCRARRIVGRACIGPRRGEQSLVGIRSEGIQWWTLLKLALCQGVALGARPMRWPHARPGRLVIRRDYAQESPSPEGIPSIEGRLPFMFPVQT